MSQLTNISVVIPVFNEHDYISACLDSLIRQTVLPDEIIICDNGSTDNTLAVIKPYQKLLPLKIVTEKNKGICSAMEKAWRSASGDLILRTDADCILPPNWVEKIQRYYIENPNLAACGGNFETYDGNAFITFITPAIIVMEYYYLYIVLGYRFLFGANFSIKKFVLEKIDGYRSSKKIPDDMLISQKLHEFGYISRFYPSFRVHTSARSFNNLHNIFWRILCGISPKFYKEKSK